MNGDSLPRTLEGWLARCEQAHRSVPGRPLERLRAIRDRLGIRFRAPVVMVAGTNGKGSTCAMIDSIARQAGRRVGLYTKPHLLSFEERCRIDGKVIDGERLVGHFEAVELARGGEPLTWFEHTTLAILSLLSSSELDLVVLEVGLGGRLDAVNVIDADCAVITAVDLDHTELLGGDREAIGYEKAGIFRAGRPAVVGDLEAPISVIDHAQAVGASLYVANRDFFAGPLVEQRWRWGSWHRQREALSPPGLRGHGQFQNASTALAVFDALAIDIPDRVVDRGLRSVSLPGRFEVVAGAPEIVLDVAHNPHAVRALVEALRAQPARGRTHLVFGCMADKDISELIVAFADLPDHWHACDLPGNRAASAASLARRVAELGAGTCTPYASAASALAAAKAVAAPEDRIVVFGSFVTVAEVARSLA